MQRIIRLGPVVVIVVIMVVEQYLGLEARGGESRPYGPFEKVALLLPGHVGGHGIAAVQGLVLQGHGQDPVAPALHLLDPADEIVRIIVVVGLAQVPRHPVVVRRPAVLAHLHPQRAAPRRGDDLHVRVDGVDLVQDGEQVLLVQRVHPEVLHPGLVAPGELVHRKIGPADAHADQRGAHSGLPAEHLRQEGRPLFWLHFQQVVAAGLGDGQTEPVHALEAFAGQRDTERGRIRRAHQADPALLEAHPGDGSGVGHGLHHFFRLFRPERSALAGGQRRQEQG